MFTVSASSSHRSDRVQNRSTRAATMTTTDPGPDGRPGALAEGRPFGILVGGVGPGAAPGLGGGAVPAVAPDGRTPRGAREPGAACSSGSTTGADPDGGASMARMVPRARRTVVI